MENMDFGRTSIDEVRSISSDKSTEISVDDAHQTLIDNTPPEAGFLEEVSIDAAIALSIDMSKGVSIDIHKELSIDTFS
ncbi:hypothetical protein F2Q69_00013109 [Brassica cretica]|uniref:Uncharacterized protein n=1 Tax=Brassica cretica TaxID=69181 RepID=A0A8S9QUM5_BRACR|nr:hypothetical protein F2Q69_00013109 [Brassica cretica]